MRLLQELTAFTAPPAPATTPVESRLWQSRRTEAPTQRRDSRHAAGALVVACGALVVQRRTRQPRLSALSRFAAPVGLATGPIKIGLEESTNEDLRLPFNPAGVGPRSRAAIWSAETLRVLCFGVTAATVITCVTNSRIEYPWGVLWIAAPTALFMAPMAALAACAALPALPRGLEVGASKENQKAQGHSVAAVLLGDSLTHGTLSSNFVEILQRRYGNAGDFVNAGMNMRAAADLDPEDPLLDAAADLAPRHGVALMLGTNDVLRALATTWPIFPGPRIFVRRYMDRIRSIAQHLGSRGVHLVLASPPILGEDLNSVACRLTRLAARGVRRVAATTSNCRYAPVFEATEQRLKELQASGAVQSPKAYNGLLASLLLVLLPFRLYLTHTPFKDLQAEQGLGLTVDYVHLGPEFAELAADVFAEALALPPEEATP